MNHAIQTNHPGSLASHAWTLPDEAATAAVAQAFAAQPGLRHALVTLSGDLGAGKTTLVRHWLRALGVGGRVKSPTYTLVEPYDPPGLPVWHCDFYRFQDPAEWDDAGLRELFASAGLKLVEWPEQVHGLLPSADLLLQLTIDDEPLRHLVAHAQTPSAAQALWAVAIRTTALATSAVGETPAALASALAAGTAAQP